MIVSRRPLRSCCKELPVADLSIEEEDIGTVIEEIMKSGGKTHELGMGWVHCAFARASAERSRIAPTFGCSSSARL